MLSIVFQIKLPQAVWTVKTNNSFLILNLILLVAALPSKGQDLTPQIQLFETYLGLEVQHGETALMH